MRGSDSSIIATSGTCGDTRGERRCRWGGGEVRVRWHDYPDPEDDTWEPVDEVQQCEALTLWLQENGQQDWDQEQTVDA